MLYKLKYRAPILMTDSLRKTCGDFPDGQGYYELAENNRKHINLLTNTKGDTIRNLY